MGLDVVILAAGQGKRMRSALPKVLHPLAGRPLLAHVIETARALEPDRICVVYGFGGQQVVDAVRAPDLTFIEQATQLGTGHALAQALPHLMSGDDVLVLFGDVPLVSPSTLAALAAKGGSAVRLLTVKLADPTGYGRIVRNAQGAIEAIVEEKDANASQREIREINTGIMRLPGDRLGGWLARLSNRNAQGEYYLTDVIAMAIAEGVAVTASEPHSASEVLGVNNKRQLAELERLYQARLAATLMDEGVTLADPARLDVRGKLICAADVAIDIDCVFEGEVTLEAGVAIGAHCVIRNTRISAGTRIEPFCMIDGAEIGQRCQVGPYSRIRPGTALAEDVHIGNFVEVKASTIGEGSKAAHLSYIGDTTMGGNVNVGAGTITCNYDGADKHRTVIEDDVFIGSDTQLVAPVTVRRGSTIGAGSTITRDTPANELTLSRARQTSIANWKRPTKGTRHKK
jgi:bifunctional UDP-N-acetylglucosamine pyrophosphorylase/glucosamine-1-phosphate N-acetyltransferase